MRCRPTVYALRLVLSCFLITSVAIASQTAPSFTAQITHAGNILRVRPGSETTFQSPDRFAVDSQGNVVVLDRGLNKVTKLSPAAKVLWSANGTPLNPKRFDLLEDVVVDDRDQVWVLNGGNNTLCVFAADGRFLRTIPLQRYPRRFVINRLGEIVANPAVGPHLFDVYSADGKYLRSFGKREKYANDTTESELNTGNLVAGPRGEVYISLVYPPVIRSYDARGNLQWEALIPFTPPLKKPNITTRAESNGQISAVFDYQVASLDLSLDGKGRLLCLAAGVPATLVKMGTSRMDVFSPTGQHLGSVKLPVAAMRMAAHWRGLFLLRANSEDISLDRYSLGSAG